MSGGELAYHWAMISSSRTRASSLPETTLAAAFYGPGDLRLEERPVPTPGVGEVLVRVKANPLCGTDGRILSGQKTSGVRRGVILGHEFGGEIARVGEGVESYAEGDRVAVYPIVSCGRCFHCLAGREQLCEEGELFGYAIDGGLAEYCLVPRRAVERGNLIPVDANLPGLSISLVEPVSACLHGFGQYGVNPGDTVVVFGAGPIGLIHIQLAKAAGASQIIVSNRSRARRERAMELGATRAIDPREESVERVARELTGGRGADVSVLCVGVPELANQALACVRGGGRVNYFAGFPKGSTAEIDPNLIHYNELIVTGGSGATLEEARQAAELLSRGVINANALVSDFYPLSKVDEAFQALRGGAGLKVAVTAEN